MMSISKTKNEIQRDYEKRTGYAAQKKYSAKTTNILLRLHPENDSDILEQLDRNKPLATQIKEFARKGINKK
jgi:hypothetical protein